MQLGWAGPRDPRGDKERFLFSRGVLVSRGGMSEHEMLLLAVATCEQVGKSTAILVKVTFEGKFLLQFNENFRMGR